MKTLMKNFTLRSTFVLASLVSLSAANATNYNNYGNNSTYQLYTGDTLRVKSGTYTGTIAIFNDNAVIIVEPMAIFKPNMITNPKGTIINNGTFTYNSSLSPNSGFSIQNFNATTISGSVQMNGLQTWYNKFGATMVIGARLEMNIFSYLLNEGTLSVGTDLQMNMFSTLDNQNQITVGGSLTVNFAQLSNEGEVSAGGMLTFNYGASFTNECRMITKGGFTNNTQSFLNLGLLWVGTSNTASDHFVNNGNFVNGPNGVVKSVNFTNNSTISGSGAMYFSGHTINYGTMGVTGSTTDSIRVYDVTRTSSSRIFDIQYGNVRPNVAYRVVAMPDTTAMLGTCANIFKAHIPLPIKWAGFFVNLTDNTPILNWAAQQTPGTIFEVERSYDGRNFTSISVTPAVEGQEGYRFDDKNVNSSAAVVYYRIKGIELTGSVSFTETRLVKFSNKQGVTIQTAPNPFTSQFSINYTADAKANLTVKLYSMNGQLQVTRNVTVNKGFNSIAVTGVSSLSKGIYLVQIISDNHLIASEKVVKQ